MKVAHLAGDLNTGAARTKWEEEPAHKFITSPETQKTRRLSRSAKDWQYYGNINDDQEKSSSAFVFGHKESGEWKFYTQVVGGFRTVLNTAALKDNITILTKIGSI